MGRSPDERGAQPWQIRHVNVVALREYRDIRDRLVRRLCIRPGEEVLDVADVADVENLQFPDESFDVVVSIFGCMYAPRHAIAASEMARVLRRGGRLAITAWREPGDERPRIVGSYQPPALWGDPEHVRALFEGTGVELDFASESSHVLIIGHRT